MRKALIVGINDYSFGSLDGCIPDANRMYNSLSRDYDDSPNFTCKKLIFKFSFQFINFHFANHNFYLPYTKPNICHFYMSNDLCWVLLFSLYSKL